MRAVQYFGIIAVLIGFAVSAGGQEPFVWNKNVPLKTPDPNNNNGKLVLFDVSHGGTQGAADWVINGAFSDFADGLVSAGYTVTEYRGVDVNGDGLFTFVDDRVATNIVANEAFLSFDAIKHADVLVLAETNRPFRVDEYEALKKFVDSGKGIYFISDHYNADRNRNTWDSTEVFNGYNRSDLAKYIMAPHYGDLRNPKDASEGWLAENFGIRFRFNAVDWKPGASDIIDAQQAEGLTTGVGPVLMAAGGTLAIVDETKAKGIVYFSGNDNPKSWGKAVEGGAGGMYFGGRQEGPYVAISKPSKGKAAFIGDSSPIEDKSGIYRREDSGRSKNLHDGWKNAGNAARLSVNIVNWLATPEDYVGFDDASHPAGFLTPQPMAAIEMLDPDNGKPWGSDRAGSTYDPWNPNTFARGAYGAKFPRDGTDGGGGMPPGDPVSVAQALSMNNRRVKVIGRVADELNNEFGLKLADVDNPTKTLAVQLPGSFRGQFSPRKNPAILNQVIVLEGRRKKYMNLRGLKNVKAIEIATPPAPPTPTPFAVAAAPLLDRSADTIPRAAMDESAAISGVLDPNRTGVFVRVVDVGAGLCCIVKVKDAGGSHFMIYDTGNYQNKRSRRSQQSGVIAFSQIKEFVPANASIDWVVQSHEDSDHIAATPQICARYQVKNFLRTGFKKSGNVRARSLAAIRDEVQNGARDWVQSSSAKRMTIGNQFKLGEATVTLLSGFGKPRDEWNRVIDAMHRPKSKRINSVSIVLRLDYQGRSILFTGDAVGKQNGSDAAVVTEKFLLDNRNQPHRSVQSDVLIAAHYGASNASSLPFIKAVKPRFVVFSSGDEHQHPKWRAVERFLKVDSVKFMFRTDLGDQRRQGEWNWMSQPTAKDKAGDDHVDIALTPTGRAYVYYADSDKRAFAVAN